MDGDSFRDLVQLAVAVGIVLPLGLILSQPRGRMPGRGGLDFSGVLAAGHPPLPLGRVALRDGLELPVRRLEGPEGAPLVIALHGSGWHGGQFDGLAPLLARHADVVIPDLRGHGRAPGRRGDVDHIGQLEEDIVDLIGAFARPGQKVVLLGHSSGGGLAVRFAGGAFGSRIHGAVLLAPYLGWKAPTARPASGGWTRAMPRRMIGLGMLNALRIHAFDRLTVLQLDMPEEVLNGPQRDLARTAYSWRMVLSYGPRRDWTRDVAALPKFLLLAGEKDEAFRAGLYAPAMSAVTRRGDYHLLPGLGHLDLVEAPPVAQLVGEFLDRIRNDD
ncbi:lysophospholipase [Pseudooceanicola sp. CBS1P-1]|uniref:Alpha/beta fold hydrolase n=1 Tax=Pseudooceanicola albus TaxID=2692189 RepID=A0A6L7GA24_9RHOB|nr:MULTISPECIES: alpha/beta fold hydrolase [Pseudooceanicola]MBT9384278.1 lysophospholipase [Pseudooceanicola endophyticus]MXN20871.1 alpha/beta fold hydrolase [Pseudooceanicola albus]